MVSKCQGEGMDIFCPSSLLALTAWVYSEPDPVPAALVGPAALDGTHSPTPGCAWGHWGEAPLRARRGTGEHLAIKATQQSGSTSLRGPLSPKMVSNSSAWSTG